MPWLVLCDGPAAWQITNKEYLSSLPNLPNLLFRSRCLTARLVYGVCCVILFSLLFKSPTRHQLFTPRRIHIKSFAAFYTKLTGCDHIGQ